MQGPANRWRALLLECFVRAAFPEWRLRAFRRRLQLPLSSSLPPMEPPLSEPPRPLLFLRDQKLYRLKAGLGSDDRKQCLVEGEISDNWEFTPRDTVSQEVLADRPPLRVCLVCDAGLGKTTNMEWLQAQLSQAGGRQVPILIRLDRQTPDERSAGVQEFERELNSPRADPLLEWLVDDLFAVQAAQGDAAPHLAALKRLQAQGRITLLIDGLDHAVGNSAVQKNLPRFLGSAAWSKCPIWTAGRPAAFKAFWKNPFGQDCWDFRRIAPLEEPEIRFYLDQTAGGDWYNLLQESHSLLAVPRFLRLISGILRGAIAGKKTAVARREAVTKLGLRTPADVYCKAYLEIGDESDPHPDPNTLGLLAQGLQENAEKDPLDDPRRIGLTREEEPGPENRRKRVERAAAILGAVAFELFCPENLGHPEPRFSGSTSHPLEEDAGRRVEEAGITGASTCARELRLLKGMNISTLDHLLFSEYSKSHISFRDRTSMAFFAAYWACRHEIPEKLTVTRAWVPDALFSRRLSYGEFWRFAAEMPDAGMGLTRGVRVDESRWLHMFQPLYDGTLRNEENLPIRSTEFIYRSWPRMETCTAGRQIIESKFRAGPVSRKLADGFIPLVHGVLPDDTGTFNMGDETMENPVTVGGFCLDKFCVTNLDYEQFDPSHRYRRWGRHHPVVQELNDKSADDECPVVMVSWYDAICYARWLGRYRDAAGTLYEIVLPTEVQWEYACRAGRKSR